jgi:hypothetical protein
LATTDRGLRAVARIQLALGVLFAITFVVAAFLARFRIPYRDDWDWIAWWLDAPVTFARLLMPSNEHLVPLPRFILSLDLWLEHTRNGLPFALALLALVGTAALFLNEIRRHDWSTRRDRTMAAGVALALLFFTWQLQTVAELAAMGYAIVEVFGVAAIACALTATDDPLNPRLRWLVGAAIACAGAAMTITNGLAAPMVVALVVFLRRRLFVAPTLFALMSLGGLAAYFWIMADSIAAGTAPASAASAGQMALFFLSFFASFGSYISPLAGVVTGAVIFVAGLVSVWPVIRRSPDVSRLHYFAAGVILFGMATALAATPGRAHFGPSQGSQSRYAAFILPYWCAVWLVLWDRVDRSSAVRVRPAIAAFALLVTLALVPLHLVTAIVWRAKSDNVSAAALALKSGVEDDRWLQTLHPVTRVVIDTAARLRALGDPAFQLPAVNVRIDDVRRLETCPSEFLALPLTRPGDYELRSSMDAAGDRGLVLDGEGNLIGLAGVAPIVASPEPEQSEVIRAVLHELRHKSVTRWLGFAHSSAAPPALVLIERDARPVCRAAMIPG